MPATTAPRALQVFDPILTGIARSYRPRGFIARQLLPTIPVQTLSGQYPVFTKDYWFQNDVDNEGTDRAPAKEVDFEWSMEPYLAKEYKLKVSITDLERSQAVSQLRLEQSKTEFLTGRMELAHEIRVAALLKKAAAGTPGGLNLGAAPSVNWDQATATIEADIKTGVFAIYDAIGALPNVMVIPYKVAYEMALQEDIRAILRSDATGQGVDFLTLGSRIIPSVIHGMRVIIPEGAQSDSAREGGTSSISEIWGDDVRLLYVDPGAGWGMPTVAYHLVHTAKRVTRWSQTDPDIDYVRELERYSLKVVAPDAGYEIQDVLS